MELILTEEVRGRMCGRKRRYESRKEARKVRNNYHKHNRGERMEVYLCPFCEFYHLGHKMGSPKLYKEKPDYLLKKELIAV